MKAISPFNEKPGTEEVDILSLLFSLMEYVDNLPDLFFLVHFVNLD